MTIKLNAPICVQPNRSIVGRITNFEFEWDAGASVGIWWLWLDKGSRSGGTAIRLMPDGEAVETEWCEGRLERASVVQVSPIDRVIALC